MATEEFLENLVHRYAEFGAAGVGVEFVERLQTEDVAGVDRVGIAQPGLDLGDRERARARRQRRAGCGRRVRLVRRGVEHFGNARDGRRRGQGAVQSDRAQYGVEPQQPARGHGGRALVTGCAGQDHLGCRHRLGKIMGRDADRALGEGDAEIAPHLPRHPGIVFPRAGPHTLVEAAQNDEIGLLQPRFDETPNRQPGVSAESRPHHHTGGERLEEGRVMPAVEEREILRRSYELVAEEGADLAGLGMPKPRAAIYFVGRGKPLGGFDVCCRQACERDTVGGEQFGERTETGLQPVDKPAQLAVAGIEGVFQSGKAGGGAGAQDPPFEPAGQVAESRRGQAPGGERVLQCGQQRHRRQAALGEIEDETEEDAGRGAAQRHARRIVDLDAPAPQFRRHAARQSAIGRHQRRRRSGRVELAAQQQRDRRRLVLGAGAVDAADPGERSGVLLRERAPRIGRRCRAESFADEPHTRDARRGGGLTRRPLRPVPDIGGIDSENPGAAAPSDAADAPRPLRSRPTRLARGCGRDRAE